MFGIGILGFLVIVDTVWFIGRLYRKDLKVKGIERKGMNEVGEE